MLNILTKNAQNFVSFGKTRPAVRYRYVM